MFDAIEDIPTDKLIAELQSRGKFVVKSHEVTEACMKFEHALYVSKGTHTPDGYYVKLWELECAIDNLRDEMIQAGIIHKENQNA